MAYIQVSMKNSKQLNYNIHNHHGFKYFYAPDNIHYRNQQSLKAYTVSISSKTALSNPVRPSMNSTHQRSALIGLFRKSSYVSLIPSSSSVL